MPPFQISSGPNITVFTWDELIDDVMPWSIPASVLGEPDVLKAADEVMAKAICPSAPDFMTDVVKDEPISGVKRARGRCQYGRIAIYVPAGPEFELLAFDLAKRDFSAAVAVG